MLFKLWHPNTVIGPALRTVISVDVDRMMGPPRIFARWLTGARRRSGAAKALAPSPRLAAGADFARILSIGPVLLASPSIRESLGAVLLDSFAVTTALIIFFSEIGLPAVGMRVRV